jgi:hypothetical protein
MDLYYTQVVVFIPLRRPNTYPECAFTHKPVKELILTQFKHKLCIKVRVQSLAKFRILCREVVKVYCCHDQGVIDGGNVADTLD